MSREQFHPQDLIKGKSATKQQLIARLNSSENELRQELEKTKRLHTLYDVVLYINGLLLAVGDETGLFQKICDALIQIDYVRFVWIGLAEKSSYSIKPIVKAGAEEGYLSRIKITFDDSDYGRGPTGTAIKTGQPFTMQDIKTDPRYHPWRKEALKRGYLSSIALPLIHEKEIIGTLNVYSGVKDAFRDDEIKFLMGAARNISIGIKWERIRQEL